MDGVTGGAIRVDDAERRPWEANNSWCREGRVYDPDLLDRLELLEPVYFDGAVWRHKFADLNPARANTRGARWNPPDVAAIYTSLERDTALAKGDYAVASQPVRPSVKRQLYEIHVTPERVLDLTEPGLLAELGVSDVELARACVAMPGDSTRAVWRGTGHPAPFDWPWPMLGGMGEAFSVEPIGYVRHGLADDVVKEQWSTLEARIEIDGDLAEGLQKIEGFSHLIVLYWMHRLREGGRWMAGWHAELLRKTGAKRV